jgi:Phage portal protein
MAPSRGGVIGSFIDPYNVTVSYGGGSGIIETVHGPLVQPTGVSGARWFSPLNPIAPIAPPEVAGRAYDFPAGYNLTTRPRAYEPVGFPQLAALANNYDILRIIIETRKDEVARLKWQIRARDEEANQQEDARVKAATKFLARPDGYHDWPDWIRMLLEDLLVYDAPSIYCQRTRAGKLLALHPVDGATIKVVIDDWGRTPLPYMDGGKLVYPVAYQQVLHGYPAVDYSVRDLLYRPRNKRVNHGYGYSPVEQIITNVNIGLRRELFTLNYFTEGTLPDSLVSLPKEWTPEQIASYQLHFDNYFGGDLASRRKVKFFPGGQANPVHQTKQPELSGHFDEWLIRVTCFAFSISPQPFVREHTRASAATDKEIAEESGLLPIKLWLKSLIDRVLENEFDAPDLEFSWEQEDNPDEGRQQEILSGYTSKGILTINEAREILGQMTTLPM